MKKNKLYTANRWNQPLFAHKFAIGGFKVLDDYNKGANFGGVGFPDTSINMPAPQSPIGGLNPKDLKPLANTPQPTTKISGSVSLMPSIGAVGAAIGGTAGNLIRGDFDDGGIGSGIQNIGGQIGSAIPGPIGGIVSLGTGLIGGLFSRMFGVKENKENTNFIKQNTSNAINAGNVLASSSDNMSLVNNSSKMVGGSGFHWGDLYQNGWFTSKGTRLGNNLIAKENTALAIQNNGLATGADNIDTNMDRNALRNFAAYGGPLDFGGGALDYGLAMDYLTMKRRDTENKNKMAGLSPIPAFSQNTFAIGGDLQTNGADFSDGLVTIGAGGSHEENPYEGVQLGADGEGVPNLVEQGETVYNDYVFSNRILADETTKQLFRLPKKKDITFADISKKLEKEIAERPNDPISKAGFEAQMQTLEEQQERQKQEMEAERARAAFEALSPEEQTAVMQNAAQQEQMAQQAAQEQAIAEQQAMQQPSPEETAMMQQQTMQADGTQAALGQEAPIMAKGGHLFANGGKEFIYKLTGSKTDREFNEWAKLNKVDQTLAWEDMLEDDAFRKAISKGNPALAHALENNYDFGAYKPLENGKATIKSISKGNWKATNGAGWLGSDDPAWLEAIEGMSEEDIKKLSTEDVARLMRATNSYKKGTEWLQNKDNALLYLNTLMNDPDTPQVAKDYAAKFIQNGQWKDGFNYDYATVFGSNGKGVRETNPGTYWHTPVEATRGTQAQNWVINDDGSIEEIIGDIPEDWTAAGNYSWATPENDMNYSYYKRPAVTSDASASSVSSATTPTKENGPVIKPVRSADWMRYAGLFGPAAGLSMQLAGVGRPDYRGLERAEAIANEGVDQAVYTPIGDYLRYDPMDIWSAINRQNANSRATDRTLSNSSNPAKMAGILANSYNNQIATGDLFAKGLEYNNTNRARTADFNRGTNQFNSQLGSQTSMANAQISSRARQFRAGLAEDVARQRMDADAGWYNSLYGNVSGLFKGLSELGKENAQRNTIAEMAATGLFGNMTPDTFIADGMLRYETDKEKKKRLTENTKCGGGKLKKRGLTF